MLCGPRPPPDQAIAERRSFMWLQRFAQAPASLASPQPVPMLLIGSGFMGSGRRKRLNETVAWFQGCMLGACVPGCHPPAVSCFHTTAQMCVLGRRRPAGRGRPRGGAALQCDLLDVAACTHVCVCVRIGEQVADRLRVQAPTRTAHNSSCARFPRTGSMGGTWCLVR